METIKITEDEFDEAVYKVLEKMVYDPDIEGMSKLFVPLIGAKFARMVKEVLFCEEENENDR